MVDNGSFNPVAIDISTLAIIRFTEARTISKAGASIVETSLRGSNLLLIASFAKAGNISPTVWFNLMTPRTSN